MLVGSALFPWRLDGEALLDACSGREEHRGGLEPGVWDICTGYANGSLSEPLLLSRGAALSLSDQGVYGRFEIVRVWLSNPSDRQLISIAELHSFQRME